MKRLCASLLVLVVLVLGIPPALSAAAPDVSFRLLDMAPWLRPDATDLHLKMLATNSGDGAADDLTFGVTVFQPTRTRNQYEESLHRDPTGVGVLFARFDDVRGKLIPGGVRILRLSDQIIREIGETLVGGDETAVYPMNIELRSGDHTVASARTPIVFLNFAEDQRIATTRLRMSWVFALHHDVDFGPDGTFLDTSLQSSIAPGGRLVREVDALADLANDPVRPRPIDVVWSPTLLAQLEAMRDGYSIQVDGTIEQVPAGEGGAADASALLDELHRLADGPLVESTALPLAVPNIPALLSAGLGVDVPVQVQRGRDAVAAFTGQPLAEDTFWPPGGYLDQSTLTTVSARGVRTFLLAPGLVHRDPQPKEFAQPATAALPNSLTTTVTGIVPDAGVTSILGSPIPQRDPRLATQDILGELAQIWLEQPGIPRAVSMSIPDSLDLPGGLFPPMLRILSRAPFLQLQKVGAIAKNFHPDPEAPARLFPNRGQAFPPDYVTEIAEARADIALYRSILVEASPEPDRLDTEVLMSEGAQFSENPPEGMAFLNDVRSDLGALFQGIRPDTSHDVTLASGRGVVPIGIVNDTPDRVRVQIRLISVRLDPESQTETVLLQGGTTRLLPFRVQSRTTGRFPVQIRVLSPDGQPLGPPQELVVRATSYNVVALILVLGAAVFLLLWWARRFLPRSRPPQATPA